MSAYAKGLDNHCYCGKRASYEVFNRLNASQGYYCKEHANRKIIELDELARQGDEKIRSELRQGSLRTFSDQCRIDNHLRCPGLYCDCACHRIDDA